jgi:glycosyltransferase involved in cell wall biosynthesis
MKRILLITHDASRTGAPMVVLHFARWLREHRPAVAVDVLAVKGGALADEFKKVADTYDELVMPPLPSVGLGQRALNKVLRLAGVGRIPSATEWKEQVLRGLAGRGYDVIHANSLVSIPVGVRIKALSAGRPLLVAHIHELSVVINQVLPGLKDHVPAIDHFLAASGLVRDELVRNWGIPAVRTEVQYEFAELKSGAATRVDAAPTQVFTVGGSGTVVLRKGWDLFIQVAHWVRAHHPELPIRFVWAGRMVEHDRPMVQRDIELSGLKDHVYFAGELKDPSEQYSAFDVLLLPSREDPFPLVCIEVGAMGKPIICFEGATGTAEVLRHGGGRIVPYLDIEAMGQAVVDYALDVARRKADGDLNRAQFAKFGPEQQCPLMLERIEEALERKAVQA